MGEYTNKRVEFQDDYVSRSYDDYDNTPKMVRFIKNHSGGIIKNEKQASYVLIGFVVVAFIIMFIFLFIGGGGKAKFKAPPGQKIIYPKNAPPRLEKKL